MRPVKKLGLEYIHPIIILPKGETYKLVFDAELLNDKTDVTKYLFLFLPAQVLIPPFSGKNFGTTDVSSDYHRFALNLETQKKFNFVAGIQ